jgi:hypothetical protein
MVEKLDETQAGRMVDNKVAQMVEMMVDSMDAKMAASRADTTVAH